jgi:hypothetical protein
MTSIKHNESNTKITTCQGTYVSSFIKNWDWLINFISRIGSSWFWQWEGQWEHHREIQGNPCISNLKPNTQ